MWGLRISEKYTSHLTIRGKRFCTRRYIYAGLFGYFDRLVPTTSTMAARAARASTRISIRWPPEPASEPTDTLVLSLDGHYVDLRVNKIDKTIDWALAGERILISEEPRKSLNSLRYTTLLAQLLIVPVLNHI